MQLSENSGGVFTKRAWHLPVKVIAEFETVVMDEKAREYVRCYAWFRLVKTWTGMRFSDTCGLLEDTLSLQSFGLTAVLAKTKTTGPVLVPTQALAGGRLRPVEKTGQGGRSSGERLRAALPYS